MNELIANQVIKVPTKEQQIENQRKRIKELEDGIRSLKATAKYDGSLNGHDGVINHFEACERLYKLIGIEVSQ